MQLQRCTAGMSMYLNLFRWQDIDILMETQYIADCLVIIFVKKSIFTVDTLDCFKYKYISVFYNY